MIRSDNERALVDGAWQRLWEVCDISHVTSLAMNSASNGLAEKRISFAERIFKTHLEGKSAKGWVEVLPTIQAMCNGYPLSAGLSRGRQADRAKAAAKGLPSVVRP